MASGDTLATFTPYANRPPASNYATLDTRNGTDVLDFDDTTGESAIFRGVLPRNYAGGGITVYVHFAATSATSGTGGWLIAVERLQDGTDTIASDSFASAATIVAVTVPGTAGIIKYANIGISNGANMDSLAVGESYRLKVTRDVANDTATGDLELVSVEVKET